MRVGVRSFAVNNDQPTRAGSIPPICKTKTALIGSSSHELAHLTGIPVWANPPCSNFKNSPAFIFFVDRTIA
jgi:hypothetical protein